MRDMKKGNCGIGKGSVETPPCAAARDHATEARTLPGRTPIMHAICTSVWSRKFSSSRSLAGKQQLKQFQVRGHPRHSTSTTPSRKQDLVLLKNLRVHANV